MIQGILSSSGFAKSLNIQLSNKLNVKSMDQAILAEDFIASFMAKVQHEQAHEAAEAARHVPRDPKTNITHFKKTALEYNSV